MIDPSGNIGGALRNRQRGFIINPYRFGGGVSGSTTWNPADKGSRIALSESDIRASVLASSTNASHKVRSVGSRNTGKRYVELLVVSQASSANNGAFGFGVAVAGFNVTNTTDFLGGTATSWGLFGPYTSGTIVRPFNNNASAGNFSAAMIVNAVIGMAVDFTAGYIWWAINNTWIQGDPAAGTSPVFSNLGTAGGPLFLVMNAYISNDSGRLLSTPTYSPPTGFTFGW